jgi:hypothetical protein
MRHGPNKADFRQGRWDRQNRIVAPGFADRKRSMDNLPGVAGHRVLE